MTTHINPWGHGVADSTEHDSSRGLREFAVLMTQPEERLELDRAALEIARIEYPALDVDGCLARLDELN